MEHETPPVGSSHGHGAPVRYPVALQLATAVALATVLLARADLAVAAAWTAAATLLAIRGPLFPAGLAALPVLLAALPSCLTEGGSPALPAGPVRVEGTVAAVRRDPLLGELAAQLQTAGGRVWLRCSDRVELLPGDRVTALARSSPPAVVGERGSLRADPDAVAVHQGHWSLPRACAAARAALERQLLQLLPGEHGILLTTLVLGSGTHLPGDLAAAHRATGLSHLLAVSGAHAAMLAWLLGLQPFGAGRRRPVGRWHLVLALLLLSVYGAITGLEPPVFRALCSYALVAAGLRLGRRVSALQALAWPALCSAVVAPEGVLGASFCLSYAAVAGLSLAGRPRGDGRCERWLLAPMRASMWATLTTAPLTLFWFGQIAPWTVLLTPLLAPLVALMLFLGLGAALLGVLVAGSNAALAPLLNALAGSYSFVVATADSLPGTPVHAAATPALPLLLAGIAAGFAALLLVRGRRGAVIACALASAPHWLPAPAAGPELHLFAVGHGQACLLTLADGDNVLIDCGSLQHASLPARKVERALRRRRIDLLVLTHGDRDHTGAVTDLLRRVPVAAAVLPAALRGSELHAALTMHGCCPLLLAPGARMDWRHEVAIAAPSPEHPTSNDCSLWVRVDVGGVSVLASGDAEEDGVRAALAQGIAGPADVLVLPHHGRSNVEGERLLASVRPRCCLCSNRHGEGRSALGELAARRGVPTFATAEAGDLLLHGGAAPGLVLPHGVPLPARAH